MLVKLDDRLKAVADLVLPGKTAADIGTDHNYLPVFLVQNNICEHVIASDRADGPYPVSYTHLASYLINRYW